MAQRVGRGIALLLHERGTRRGWVVSSTPQPHFTPGKDPVPILQEAGWTPALVWTAVKSRPHRDSVPDRPARSPVPIPTELPGPLIYIYIYLYSKTPWRVFKLPFLQFYISLSYVLLLFFILYPSFFHLSFPEGTRQLVALQRQKLFVFLCASLYTEDLTHYIQDNPIFISSDLITWRTNRKR